jgi:hypothetical protein
MATSDNPFVVPNVVTGADEPEDHQHDVPIVNIEDGDQKTLEDDYGAPPLEPEDEVPEEDPDDEPLAEEYDAVLDARGDRNEVKSDDELFPQRRANAESNLA